MKLGIVTLFPEMLAAVTEYGITGRAVEAGIVALQCWNPRDFTHDRHRTVDDRPYGGGPGMLMKMQPLKEAIAAAKAGVGFEGKVVYLSPQGKRLDQSMVESLAKEPSLVLVAGRYEGVDERLIEAEIDEEISVGDFVLSGGELPAMVLIDALIRLLPGALGHNLSAEQDSFAEGLLDCPHYTRPEIFQGMKVPSVLLGGNHEDIRLWRLKQSLGRTWQRRPDLLADRVMSEEEQQLLDEFIREADAQ